MADKTIGETTLLTTPAVGDLVPVVDISEAADEDKNKKITYGDLVGSWSAYAQNYSIAAEIFTFETVNELLKITILAQDGSPQTSSNYSTFNVNGTILKLTNSFDLYVRNENYFKWTDCGIANHVVSSVDGNDAQLFVYAVNNNGTLMFGASPCPTLKTVAGNYAYNYAQAAGVIGYTNMITSGAVLAGNTCQVIGRINVRQCLNENWIEPKVAKITDEPVYHTDVLDFTPIFVAGSGSATNLFMSYYIRDSVGVVLGGTKDTDASVSGGTTSQPIKFYTPIPAKDAYIKYKVSNHTLSDLGWCEALAYIQSKTTLVLYKTSAGVVWTTGITLDTNMRAEYPIDD